METVVVHQEEVYDLNLILQQKKPPPLPPSPAASASKPQVTISTPETGSGSPGKSSKILFSPSPEILEIVPPARPSQHSNSRHLITRSAVIEKSPPENATGTPGMSAPSAHRKLNGSGALIPPIVPNSPTWAAAASSPRGEWNPFDEKFADAPGARGSAAVPDLFRIEEPTIRPGAQSPSGTSQSAPAYPPVQLVAISMGLPPVDFGPAPLPPPESPTPVAGQQPASDLAPNVPPELAVPAAAPSVQPQAHPASPVTAAAPAVVAPVSAVSSSPRRMITNDQRQKQLPAPPALLAAALAAASRTPSAEPRLAPEAEPPAAPPPSATDSSPLARAPAAEPPRSPAPVLIASSPDSPLVTRSLALSASSQVARSPGLAPTSTPERKNSGNSSASLAPSPQRPSTSKPPLKPRDIYKAGPVLPQFAAAATERNAALAAADTLYTPEEVTAIVEQLLADPSHRLVRSVVEALPRNDDELLPVLLPYLASLGPDRVRAFVDELLLAEVRSTPDPTLLLRARSSAARVLTAFVRLYGGAYLRGLVGWLLAELLRCDHALEMDTHLLVGDSHGPDARAAHTELLADLSERLLSRIIESRSQVPRQFRHVCALLAREAAARWPILNAADAAQVAVGTFFFLRVLCPAITLLPGTEPPQHARRTATMVSKIMQQLGNNVLFNEEHMRDLNVCLEHNRSKVRELVTDLCVDDSRYPDGVLEYMPPAGGPAKALDGWLRRYRVDLQTYLRSLDHEKFLNLTVQFAPDHRLAYLLRQLQKYPRISANASSPPLASQSMQNLAGSGESTPPGRRTGSGKSLGVSPSASVQSNLSAASATPTNRGKSASVREPSSAAGSERSERSEKSEKSTLTRSPSLPKLKMGLLGLGKSIKSKLGGSGKNLRIGAAQSEPEPHQEALSPRFVYVFPRGDVNVELFRQLVTHKRVGAAMLSAGLVDLRRPQLDTLVDQLVAVAHFSGKAYSLLKHLAGQRRTGGPAAALLTNRAFESYCALMCRGRFIQDSKLAAQVRDVIAQAAPLEETAPAGHTLELDNFSPSKLLANARKFQSLICAAAPLIPRPVWRVVHAVYVSSYDDALEEPDDDTQSKGSRLTLIVNVDKEKLFADALELLFAGLFCRLLEFPEEFGIVDKQPGRVARTLLQLYSKLFWHIASRQKFTGNSTLMIRFIEENVAGLRAVYQDWIAQASERARATLAKWDAPLDYRVVDEHLHHLFFFATDHLPAVTARLQAVQISEKLSVQLSDIMQLLYPPQPGDPPAGSQLSDRPESPRSPRSPRPLPPPPSAAAASERK